MSGGFDKVLDPRLTQGMKFNKFRRLSHVKRQWKIQILTLWL